MGSEILPRRGKSASSNVCNICLLSFKYTEHKKLCNTTVAFYYKFCKIRQFLCIFAFSYLYCKFRRENVIRPREITEYF